MIEFEITEKIPTPRARLVSEVPYGYAFRVFGDTHIKLKGGSSIQFTKDGEILLNRWSTANPPIAGTISKVKRIKVELVDG